MKRLTILLFVLFFGGVVAMDIDFMNEMESPGLVVNVEFDTQFNKNDFEFGSVKLDNRDVIEDLDLPEWIGF